MATVRAKDPDGDGVLYLIAGGNEEGNFELDSQKGKKGFTTVISVWSIFRLLSGRFRASFKIPLLIFLQLFFQVSFFLPLLQHWSTAIASYTNLEDKIIGINSKQPLLF